MEQVNARKEASKRKEEQTVNAIKLLLRKTLSIVAEHGMEWHAEMNTHLIDVLKRYPNLSRSTLRRRFIAALLTGREGKNKPGPKPLVTEFEKEWLHKWICYQHARCRSPTPEECLGKVEHIMSRRHLHNDMIWYRSWTFWHREAWCTYLASNGWTTLSKNMIVLAASREQSHRTALASRSVTLLFFFLHSQQLNE